MLLQSGLRLIIISMNCCLFDRFVHSLDLTICPRMRRKSEPVLDSVFLTNPIKNMRQSPVIPSLIRELNAVVCQNCMNFVRNFFDFATFGTNLRNINVKIANRIFLELLFRLFLLIFRQFADTVTLKKQCSDERERCGICSLRANKQSSSGSKECLRKATQIVSSSRVSTVE